MSGSRIYRVQDHEGRGPYRPGFSKEWVEEDGPLPELPPLLLLPKLRELVNQGNHVGYGFESLEQARDWFLPIEREKLGKLGYALVKMRVDLIVWSSKRQLLFARRSPLRNGATAVDWQSGRH